MADRAPTPASGAWPTTIGKFRILRVLGEGGMGTVFEAEQAEPRRRVALKVIRTGQRVSAEQIRLFQREAQALALLAHPSVAQIYETGRTDDGQHYFAMELVRGQSLGEYMATHPITGATGTGEIRRLLGLFRDISDAVSYAHQRGVIHRDLKPSNILVRDASVRTEGSQGVPQIKILDFGIARITDVDTVNVTRTEGVVGTIAYMSPEQAAGNPDQIDLRSDIYSLGVILYEMLTGQLPYKLPGLSFAALHTIMSQPPERPSVVWRRLGRRMDPDLETIVLKALAKEVDRRYQSAWTLAEDIDRYLTRQPILARPPDAWYQLRKLAARYRGPVYTAAAAVLTLVIGLVQANRSRASAVDAREEAEAQARRAEATSDFLLNMLGSADPRDRGRDARVVDVLDRAADEAGRSFAGDPRLQAAMRTTIGKTYAQLGAYDEARSQLEAGLALRLEQGDPDLGESLDELGLLEAELAHFDSALVLHRAGLEERRSRLGPRDPRVARSLQNLAAVMIETGDYDGARQHLEEALSIRRDEGDDYEISLVLENLAVVDYQSGSLAGAERGFEAALAMRRSVLGDDHLDVATGLNNLAIVLTAQERFDEAERRYEESLAMYRRLLGDEHASVARAINNLGMFFYRQTRYEEAEARFREAARLNEAALGADHPEVAANLNNLGLVLRDTRRYAEAERALRRALDIDFASRPGHEAIPQSRNNLGSLLLLMGRPAEAEALHRTARVELTTLFSESDFRVATTDSLIGACLIAMGRAQEAVPILRRAFETLTTEFPVEHGRVQATLQRLVSALEAVGDVEEAGRFRAMLNG